MTALQNLIGQTLGQYKIIEQIGEGGMATVFRAYQPGLNREVAVKVLPPYVAKKPGFTDRFMREAQAIGNLNHPNILPVHDSGQDKEYSYIVMRYVPNARTLAHLMAQKLAPEKIVQLISQIAAALDHAHQAGIIHRDVKPSNILMDGDWVLLSDFGLAKMVEMSSELTGAGVGVGTPSYMSPEQAKGEKLDQRTDIYSLGIILFEMLTGQIPHKAETPLATVIKRINEPMPRPRSLNPDIPGAVEQVLLKALATNPADRFVSAGEMATTLRLAFAGEPAHIAPAIRADDSLAVPRPQEQVNRWDRLAEPAPVAVPVSQSPQPAEFIIIGLLGLVSLCAFSGIFLALTTSSDTGQSNAPLAPACIGLTLAGITSAGMLWIRNRRQSASAWLALGVVAWFLGLNILGWGGFAALNPNEDNFVENLGMSLALCFVPGGVLTLLGLGLYGYDYRRGRQMTVAMSAAALSRSAQERTEKLKRATEYCSHINRLIKQKKGTPIGGQLAPLAPKLNQWEARLRQLVQRLDSFETNSVIQRDLRETPAAINRLQTQLAAEANPHLRAEMQETLTRFQQQQQQLNSLVTLMRRTELDIDETLAAIGAIYSQLQLLGAKDIDNQRAKRLSADVEEQNQHLNDLLAAMEEVYEGPAAQHL
jgi:hypothetical protein